MYTYSIIKRIAITYLFIESRFNLDFESPVFGGLNVSILG